MLSSIMETAWRSAPMNFSVPITLVPATQMPLAHAVWFSTRVTAGLEAYRPDIFRGSSYRSVQQAAIALRDPRTYNLFDDKVLTPEGPDDNNWLTRRAAAVAFAGTYVMPTVAVGSRPVPFPAEVHGAIEVFSHNHRMEALDALLQSVGGVLARTLGRLAGDEEDVTDEADLMGYGMLSYIPSSYFDAGGRGDDEGYGNAHVLLGLLAVAALCRNIPPPPLSSRFVWKSYATAIARLEAAVAEEARVLRAMGEVPADIIDDEVHDAIPKIGQGYRLGWLESALVCLGMRHAASAAARGGINGVLKELLSSARFVRGAGRRLLLEIGGKLALSCAGIGRMGPLGNMFTESARVFYAASGNDFMDLKLGLEQGATLFGAAQKLIDMKCPETLVIASLLAAAYSASPDWASTNRIDRLLVADLALAEVYCRMVETGPSGRRLRDQVAHIRSYHEITPMVRAILGNRWPEFE